MITLHYSRCLKISQSKMLTRWKGVKPTFICFCNCDALTADLLFLYCLMAKSIDFKHVVTSIVNEASAMGECSEGSISAMGQLTLATTMPDIRIRTVDEARLTLMFNIFFTNTCHRNLIRHKLITVIPSECKHI